MGFASFDTEWKRSMRLYRRGNFFYRRRELASALLIVVQNEFMKFCIAVGQADRHVIEFSFNQLLGQLKISVNNHEVKRNRRLFNEPLLESHTLEVGDCASLRG